MEHIDTNIAQGDSISQHGPKKMAFSKMQMRIKRFFSDFKKRGFFYNIKKLLLY